MRPSRTMAMRGHDQHGSQWPVLKTCYCGTSWKWGGAWSQAGLNPISTLKTLSAKQPILHAYPGRLLIVHIVRKEDTEENFRNPIICLLTWVTGIHQKICKDKVWNADFLIEIHDTKGSGNFIKILTSTLLCGSLLQESTKCVITFCETKLTHELIHMVIWNLKNPSFVCYHTEF